MGARGQYRVTAGRRGEILNAALSCFNEAGFLHTTMEDICRRAKASNGSVYHHFANKERLAAEVYVAGLLDYQNGLVAALGSGDDAREGIRAIVRYHLSWVAAHEPWARYLSTMRHTEAVRLAADAIAAGNQAFVAALGAFFRRHQRAGTLRRLPPELCVALLLGPSQELTTHWLLRGKSVDLEGAIDALGEAAWRSLRNVDSTPKRSIRRSS